MRMALRLAISHAVRVSAEWFSSGGSVSLVTMLYIILPSSIFAFEAPLFVSSSHESVDGTYDGAQSGIDQLIENNE
jgi:hypothetical protein